MPTRVLLGNHPHGYTGLFISKPGVDVEATSPNDQTNLLFSTQWSSTLSVLAAGACTLNAQVTLPDLGFKPYVRFEAQYTQAGSTTYDAFPHLGFTQFVGQFDSRRYEFTRYMLVYDARNVFRIVRAQPIDSSTDDNNQIFRFIAFNLPVD